VRYFSVKIAGPKLWNSISASIRDLCSQTTFKNAYKSFLLDVYHHYHSVTINLFWASILSIILYNFIE